MAASPTINPKVEAVETQVKKVEFYQYCSRPGCRVTFLGSFTVGSRYKYELGGIRRFYLVTDSDFTAPAKAANPHGDTSHTFPTLQTHQHSLPFVQQNGIGGVNTTSAVYVDSGIPATSVTTPANAPAGTLVSLFGLFTFDCKVQAAGDVGIISIYDANGFGVGNPVSRETAISNLVLSGNALAVSNNVQVSAPYTAALKLQFKNTPGGAGHAVTINAAEAVAYFLLSN